MSAVDSIPTDTASGFRSENLASHNHVVGAIARGLDAVGEFCLLVIIFAVPLTMAVIRETGIAVFVTCSFIMSIAWAIRELLDSHANSRFSWPILIPVLGVALVAMQLCSLPQSLLHFVSPFHVDYLSVWNQGHELLAGNQSWSRLSLTPSLTRSGLVLLVAYVLFFLTLVQKLNSLESIDRLLKYMAASIVVVAMIGLGQLFFGNGRFLWMFEHDFRDASWPAKATFTNQNHFAHLLALGIGPLAWVWKLNSNSTGPATNRRSLKPGFGSRRSSGSLHYFLGAMIAIVLFAGLLSFSRGGISVLLIASAISVVAVGKKLAGIARMALPMAGFVALGILVFGTEALETKWNSITGAETVSELSVGRFSLWSALLDAVPHFWLAGSGVGSHAEVYPVWLTTDFGVRFSHAESGYLQVLIETGVLGFGLVLLGVCCNFYWVAKALRYAGSDSLRRTRILILLSGLCVTVMHSAVDFVWFIPACMIFGIMTIACLFRVYQLYSPDTPAVSSAWPTNLALILILSAIPIGSLSADVVERDMMSEASWSAYRKDAVAASRSGVFNSPDDLDERLDRMVLNLEACLRHDSADFRAMSELATLYLRRFERAQQNSQNPMSLREIKNTVETSGFESQKEVAEWLQRAFGSHVTDLYRSLLMAENAVTGQPLRGECYLVLAQVGFLKEISYEDANRLVEQSVRLRPHNAGILYFVGLLEAEKGDVDAACDWWKKAFHLSKELQPVILRGLEPHMAPSEIVGYLDPGVDALWSMYQSYQRQQNTEYVNWVADYYRTEFNAYLQLGGETTPSFWIQSEQIFTALNELEISTECLGRAVKMSPNNFDLRKRYALALLAIHKNDTARRELDWCRLKSPNDSQITDALRSLDELIGEGANRVN